VATTTGYRDYAGRYVYPNDAEDIKSHRWFKDIQWERLHLMTPPFVPAIKSMDDTQYFDEEDPISDFSSSHEYQPEPPTDMDLDGALRCFNREIQILARGYVAGTYDSARLRRIEKEIEGFVMGDEQKEYLRGFVRVYGQKERKRPRDILLRDREIASKVLEVRRRGAFLGYSYRRIRQRSNLRIGVSEWRKATMGGVKGSNDGGGWAGGSGNGAGTTGIGSMTRGGTWLKGRLSIN
jgi:protein-serine/threonine kinase